MATTPEIITSGKDLIYPKDRFGLKRGSDRNWQVAGDRALLYLRCLNFPASQALELTLEAFKRAEREIDSGANPTREVMRKLNQLLEEKSLEDSGFGPSSDFGCPSLALSTPPLERRSMTSEEVFFGKGRSLPSNLRE